MLEKLKNLRQRILPGNTLAEILANEFKDFFWTGNFRPQFWLMAGYAIILLAVVFYANRKNHFSASEGKIAISFLALAAYFIVSDFLKRKKLLAMRQQFLLDAYCYALLMIQVIISTGAHDSPITFSLLFLTAVSAPLYGSFLETAFFIMMIVVIYTALAAWRFGADSFISYFKAMEGMTLLVAALSVKISLAAYQKKVREYEALEIKQEALAEELDEHNRKLESVVREKTRELSAALKDAKGHEDELFKQKKAILNILEDIADEKKLSTLEQEKLSRILQSIGDAVIAVDRERNIIIFNRVAENITGWLSGEVSGRRYSDFIKLFFEKDRVENDVIARVFDTGKIQELTNHTILITKKGKEVPIDDSAAPILDKEGNIIGCIMVFRDVTREREIDRQKSEFVSVASHQLRTPLTSIKWFLEMILDGDAGEVTKEQRELLTQIAGSSERMIDLVNKLLNISRIESGRVRVAPAPTDLNELIKSVAAEVAPLAKEKKLKLEVKTAILPKVNIDPKLIREVIANLFSNAIKYTPGGGKIGVKTEKKGEDVFFSIEDSGIGIPKKQHLKIFNKFFRAENAVVQETEGTGMGLYVARSVVELSGGKMWFKSEENKGSTFFFTLPLKGSIMREGEKSLV